MNLDKNRSSSILIILLLVLLVPLLAGCSGRRLAATSWPGIDVEEDIAYIAFNQGLFAIDSTEQKVVWEYRSDDAKSTFYAAPTIADGMLVLGGYDSVLYGLDRENLTIRWSFHLASDRYIGSPVLFENTIFAATAGNEIFALDLEKLEGLGTTEKPDESRRKAEETAVLWKSTAKHGIWASPLVTTEAVYFTSLDHNVYALNRTNGQEIWRQELTGAMASTPVLLPDEGILVVGNFDHFVYGLDVASGNTQWKVESENWVWGQPTVAGNKIFFGDLGGYLYAVEPQSGAILWKEQVADAIRGESIYDAARGQLIVAGRKVANPGNISTRGIVLALDIENFKVNWEQAVDEAIYTHPAVAGDLVIVAPAQGDVLMQTFHADTGVVQWRFTPEEVKE